VDVIVSINSLPAYTLNYDQKQSLTYMWDEERLARDLYKALYNQYPNAKPLYNIYTKSETKHVTWVEALAEKYDLNLTNTTDLTGGYSAQVLSAYAEGIFILPELKNLYDTLYAEGVNSEVDALKVGCKVEVTDVNDLNSYITVAGSAKDMKLAYENLCSGSYNHYWAFDGALKQRGMSDGCCSLGANYCHPEYPQQQNVQGHGQQ